MDEAFDYHQTHNDPNLGNISHTEEDNVTETLKLRELRVQINSLIEKIEIDLRTGWPDSCLPFLKNVLNQAILEGMKQWETLNYRNIISSLEHEALILRIRALLTGLTISTFFIKRDLNKLIELVQEASERDIKEVDVWGKKILDLMTKEDYKPHL